MAGPLPLYGGPRGYRGGRQPGGRGRWAVFGALGTALAIGGFFAGAAKLARAPAEAWTSGKRFSGRTGGDVGPRLGRRGPELGGALEPAGWWSAPSLLSEQFVVGTSSGAYGLSVVVYKGYVVYPPTPARLSFVEPSPLAPTCPRRARR